jgi:hypothetical protein
MEAWDNQGWPGSVDGLLRGLKHEALTEPVLCIALLRSLTGAHRDVFPLPILTTETQRCAMAGRLSRGPTSMGSVPPVDGVSKDEIGLES